MKNLIIFLFCAVACSASEIKLPKDFPISFGSELLKLQHEVASLKNERGMISVDINKYLDKTMQLIQLWVVKQGLDPMEAEDIGKKIKVGVGIIAIKGEVWLSQGWLQGLSTVQRGGEARLTYEAQYLNIRLPLAFPSVLINYDYRAKLMGIGPKGGIVGKVKNLQLLVDFNIDTKTMEITLQNFKIVDAGKITLKFAGNPITDLVSNILTNAITTLLHDIITKILQKRVKVVVQEAVDQINQALQPKNNYVH